MIVPLVGGLLAPLLLLLGIHRHHGLVRWRAGVICVGFGDLWEAAEREILEIWLL